ncbi:hypothetical protein ACLKA7_014368 [Drosophila subpalustris]
MWSWQRMRHKPLWALISLTILLLVLDKSQANTEAPTVESTTTTEPVTPKSPHFISGYSLDPNPIALGCSLAHYVQCLR